MSIDLFRRGMKWRAEAEKRLETRRAELSQQAGGRPMVFGSGSGGASGADHVDSYWEYRRLVGESDGGNLLGEAEYAELRKLAAAAARNRLYVTWRNGDGLDCYTVGPDTRCFCGHSYKAHAWYNTESKKVHCRCKGCACEGFEYVAGHGAWWIKCTCKHEHRAHANGRGACSVPYCGCRTFFSSFGCACGQSWAEHTMAIETRRERSAANRPTHNLCGGGGVGEAAAGGITRMSSLVPGIDRIESPLPFTDAGFFAHRLPSGAERDNDAGLIAGGGGGNEWSEPPPPSRQQLLDSLPDESHHLLACLLDEPSTAAEEEAAEAERDAGRSEAEREEARHKALILVEADAACGGGFGPSVDAAPRKQDKAPASRMGRSAVIQAHDAALRAEIEEIVARMQGVGLSAAARHGLKKQLAAKKAALKRDVVPGLRSV